MISELRIKCPSCGVILDIKNSKNEAVKRVTCPNCKKQLAVDFQEKPMHVSIEALYYGQMPIPMREGLNHVPIPGCEHLEVNVVRVDNGSFKYIVYSTSAEHPVILNDVQLEAEDKTLLAKGDKLQVGNTSLSFGKPSEQLVTDGPTTQPIPPQTPRKSHFYRWIGGCLAALTAVLLVYQRTKPERPQPSQPKPAASISELSDYELEQQAIKGNVAAQCELGKRWVARGDSISVVKGIQYIKLALQNGSAEAGNALRRVYGKLEEKAAAGNITAENILREQR